MLLFTMCLHNYGCVCAVVCEFDSSYAHIGLHVCVWLFLFVRLFLFCVQGFQQSFSTNLLKWMRDSGFTEVVLLTSSYAHERRDIQIQG